MVVRVLDKILTFSTLSDRDDDDDDDDDDDEGRDEAWIIRTVS